MKAFVLPIVTEQQLKGIVSIDLVDEEFYLHVLILSGAHCEQCASNFYGDPRNGQFCSGKLLFC